MNYVVESQSRLRVKFYLYKVKDKQSQRKSLKFFYEVIAFHFNTSFDVSLFCLLLHKKRSNCPKVCKWNQQTCFFVKRFLLIGNMIEITFKSIFIHSFYVNWLFLSHIRNVHRCLKTLSVNKLIFSIKPRTLTQLWSVKTLRFHWRNS